MAMSWPLNTRRTPQAISQASTKQVAKAPKAIKDSGRANASNKPVGSSIALLLKSAMKVSFFR